MSDTPADSKKQKALHGLSLQKKLRELLSSGEYTRGDKIGKGAGLIGIGVACAVFAFIIYLTGYIAVIQILLIPGAVICGLWGLIKLLDGLATSQETFNCPSCATQTALLEHLTARPCPECLHVIYKLGNMRDARSFIGTCSHCLSESCLYAGAGEFRCPNCGSHLAINPKSESLELRIPAAAQCACGAQLPDGAFACRHCHTLVPDQEISKIDDLTLCSLSPWGHLIRTRASCDRLRSDIASLGETRPSLEPLRGLITRIQETLASLEVAAQEHALGTQTGAVLGILQETYTYVLAGLHSVLTSKKTWNFDADSRILLPTASQHRVLNSLGTQPEGVRQWTENLITYTVEKKKSSTGEETRRYVVTSYDKLLQEARRLSGDEPDDYPDVKAEPLEPVEPVDKVPCRNCAVPILPATAGRTEGLCMPCFKANPKGREDRRRELRN